MNFSGKVVIVTGANRGIGRSIAMAYIEKGAKLVLADLDQYADKELEKIIIALSGTSTYIQTDVSNPNDIVELIRKTEEA